MQRDNQTFLYRNKKVIGYLGGAKSTETRYSSATVLVQFCYSSGTRTDL